MNGSPQPSATKGKPGPSCWRWLIVVVGALLSLVPIAVSFAYRWALEKFQALSPSEKDKLYDRLFDLGIRYLSYWDGSELKQGRGLDIPASLMGKKVVITGATRGVGYHAAKEFHALGADVLFSGTSARSASAAAAAIVSTTKSVSACIGFPLDLADFDNGVHPFAASVIERFGSVDYLLLNAGMTYGVKKPPYQGWWDKGWLSRSGHCKLFSTNHLGHFLLTALLAPVLAPGATVVVVSSVTAWWGVPRRMMVYWGNPNHALARTPPKHRWDKFADAMYETSKLANACTSRMLRSKLAPAGVKVVMMTPGMVATRMNALKENDPRNPSVSPERGGRVLFESTFVSREPMPDMITPYWGPEFYFKQVSNLSMSHWRATDAGLEWTWRPERMGQGVKFALHASIGPDCQGYDRRLWRWSRVAVGLPPEVDGDDLVRAGARARAGVGRGGPPPSTLARCAIQWPRLRDCEPTQPTLPFPDFSLEDQEGRLVSLDSFPARPLLVFSCPSALTECKAEVEAFEAVVFPKAGITELVGVVRLPLPEVSRMAASLRLSFTLLSDPSGSLQGQMGNASGLWACLVDIERRFSWFQDNVDPHTLPRSIIEGGLLRLKQ